MAEMPSGGQEWAASIALSTLRRLDKEELNKLPQVNLFPVLDGED